MPIKLTTLYVPADIIMAQSVVFILILENSSGNRLTVVGVRATIGRYSVVRPLADAS